MGNKIFVGRKEGSVQNLQGGPSASGKNYVDDNSAIAPGWIGGVKHVLNEQKQGIARYNTFYEALMKKLLVVSLEVHICRTFFSMQCMCLQI